MAELIDSHPAVDDLRAEQVTRWERADRVRLTELLGDRRGLADDPEAVLDLVYAEVLLREEYGERPAADEYLSAFPHLAGPVGRLFRVHRDLAALETDAPTEAGPDTPLPEGAVRAPATDGRSQLGVYELLEELGRGGMGVVYKAAHAVTGRLAAVKVLRAADATGRERARFLTEARAVAALSHPNIVQVYEVSAPAPGAGTPFVALEYVAGGSLAARLAGAPLPPREAAELVRALAGAVAHAHAHGIVHRDLKPANVLLAGPNTRTPKVTDFGLAKRLDVASGQTRTGDLLGTPSYMAPEQTAGDPDRVGPPADIYALGAILYECLTGRPPFRGPTVLDTLAHVRGQEPVGPCRLNPAVPRDLEAICLKCLQKDPARRYASAGELADDLSRFLAGAPIRARPVGWPERAGKWVRRRPGAAAAIGGAVLAVAALMAVWASFTVRLEEERRAAVRERQRADEQAGEAGRRAEEARAQADRAGRLLTLTAAAVDDIAINARASAPGPARSGSAAAVLFKLAAIYARGSAALASEEGLPVADRERLAEQYAVSAVRLLNCAEQAGWFEPTGPGSRQALDADPAFAPLRDRADFRQFRQRLR